LGTSGIGSAAWKATLLARNFSVENWEKQEEEKGAYKKEKRSKQPSSTAEIR